MCERRGIAALDAPGRKLPEAEPLPEPELQMVEAEIDRQIILRDLVRAAVGNTKTDDDYNAMTIKARGDYAAFERRPGPVRRFGRRLAGLAALGLLMIAGAYRAQDRVLGGRAR